MRDGFASWPTGTACGCPSRRMTPRRSTTCPMPAGRMSRRRNSGLGATFSRGSIARGNGAGGRLPRPTSMANRLWRPRPSPPWGGGAGPPPPPPRKTSPGWAFCEGINRLIFHRYAMQPWKDRKPGMTMGPWGVHYERTQTWWEQSKPWHEYLARCQYLLRQGRFVADLCYLQPEGAPMRFQSPGVDPRSPEPPVRPGYNYDGCTPEVVLTRMSVKDGRLVLPDGTGYRMLVLPEPGAMPWSGTMTPGLLARILKLVEAGATVVGPRPLKSPSLSGYPECDTRLERLADHLWGDCDGKSMTEHRVGKGRAIWGRTPPQVLAEAG